MSTSQTAEEPNAVSPNASLEWDENGQPLSTQFSDVYFSKASGINETRYVFLEKNQLPQRFSQLITGLTDQDTFVIGETGFGTGLNFLCAWQLFEQSAPADTRLHFISTEKYPLSSADLTKALSLWPELSNYSDQLLGCYLPTCNGFHHLEFAEGRVKLTLLVGDVLATLPLLEAKIDAWFLDGFAPSKNPGMWQPQLFKTLAEKSADQATYSTFTAARMVRDGLIEAGFSVKKTQGFGRKRDMIHGQLISPQKVRSQKPLWNSYPSQPPIDKSAVVIGGGLSGTSCARSLAERGWQVTLLEQHDQLAKEASGNPQGILYAKLSASQTGLSRLIAQGYCYSLNLIRQLETKHPGTRHACGVIQLATSDSVRHRYQKLAQQFPKEFLQFLDKQQLSRIAGMSINHDGLFFPEAGWVSPPDICQQLVQHPNIIVKTNTAIDQLALENGQWLLKNKGKTVLLATTVVIAEGVSTLHTPQLAHLPLKGIRGQITQISATQESEQLNTCVCGEGYVAPATDHYHTLGATFDFNSDSTDVNQADHLKNLSMQSEWFPSFTAAAGNEHCQIEGGKAGFRCTTPDYLPVVGPVVNKARFLETFAMLRKNVKHPFSQKPEYLKGLYVTAGHGSRGLITCPLAGELLACMISGDTIPVPSDILDQLNPTRFLVRDLSRNKI